PAAPVRRRDVGFFPLTARGAGRSRTDDGGFAIRCLSHLATAPCPCRVELTGGGLIESYCRPSCRSRGSQPDLPGVPCGARNSFRIPHHEEIQERQDAAIETR